jgi:hypothetical protein
MFTKKLLNKSLCEMETKKCNGNCNNARQDKRTISLLKLFRFESLHITSKT